MFHHNKGPLTSLLHLIFYDSKHLLQSDMYPPSYRGLPFSITKSGDMPGLTYDSIPSIERRALGESYRSGGKWISMRKSARIGDVLGQ
jgi:hypothetical protein